MQEFQELSCHAKLLWIYLGNNDHCNHAALYKISLTTIHNETKIPETELPALFTELESDVEWYPDIHTVWVKSFLQEQSLGPLFMRGVSRILQAADPQLVAGYLAYNRSMGIMIPMDGLNGKGLETLPKPLEEGLPTVSKPRRQDKTRQDLSVLSCSPPITDNVSSSDSGNGRGESERGTPRGPETAQSVADLFNQICGNMLPTVQHLKGTARLNKVMARWKEHPDLEWWGTYFRKVIASPLLSGQKDGWKASFDWLLEPKNMIKVVEGNYDGGTSTGPSAKSLPTGEALKKGWSNKT
jgi:hypothetical protein